MEKFNIAEPLANAIKDLQTAKRVNIKGKMYATVSSRVDIFRKFFPMASVKTEIIYHDEVRVIVQAKIFIDSLQIGSGLAEEIRGKGIIENHIEVAETSALGRCLASIGLSGSSEYASSFEVEKANAMQQTSQQPQRNYNQPQQKEQQQAQNSQQYQHNSHQDFSSLSQLGLEVQQEGDSLIVLGQTFGKQETLKQLNFHWDPSRKIWHQQISQQQAA